MSFRCSPNLLSKISFDNRHQLTTFGFRASIHIKDEHLTLMEPWCPGESPKDLFRFSRHVSTNFLQ
jgi:hypothetical protein